MRCYEANDITERKRERERERENTLVHFYLSLFRSLSLPSSLLLSLLLSLSLSPPLSFSLSSSLSLSNLFLLCLVCEARICKQQWYEAVSYEIGPQAATLWCRFIKTERRRRGRRDSLKVAKHCKNLSKLAFCYYCEPFLYRVFRGFRPNRSTCCLIDFTYEMSNGGRKKWPRHTIKILNQVKLVILKI